VFSAEDLLRSLFAGYYYDMRIFNRRREDRYVAHSQTWTNRENNEHLWHQTAGDVEERTLTERVKVWGKAS